VGNSQKQRNASTVNEEKTNKQEGEQTMRKSHLIVLAVILITSISTSAMAADAQPVPVSTPTGVVNINTADTTQLALLPRVGVKAAQRIADYRKEHGNFRKTSDLMQVKGFGQKSFERLSAYVTVDGKTTLTAKIHIKSPRKSSKKPASPTPAAR
jgi:competence ComEA-like helix-hairpin-helix protein